MIDKSIFKNVKYFVADLDGTVYLNTELIDGAKEFFELAVRNGCDYCFLTNNSSNNSAVCLDKLTRMGFPVPEEKIIVSTHVAIDYIKKHHPGKSVYLIGNSRLTSDFKRSGIPLTDSAPDIVVLGLDDTLTYEKIRKGCNYIIRGALFIATHPDIKAPMGGDYMPDAGSMMAMFSACTGVEPLVMGKPEVFTADYLTELLHCSREEICIIGDSLAADIALGARHGMKTALVMTGVTTPEIYQKSDIRADVAVDSIKDLCSIFD
ncbi:MAG: HAD-IIA family hydrolase [Clostridia bacterium]|nr:HAD-IIA family hydrolase [Clostridia bacterium]